MQVDIKQLSALRLAALRHVGAYMLIGKAFSRLAKIIGPTGLVGQPGVQMVALYYDDPEVTPAPALQSDAALSVPESVTLPEGLSEIRIPEGRYAQTTFVGHYAGLPAAWAEFVGAWLPRSGQRRGQGPSFEIYRNTPGDTAPEKLLTELYLPLA